MQIKNLLDQKNISLFLVQRGMQPDIVVSAIHHAPAGVPVLPCNRHKPSDESVGYIALMIAKKLQCSLIIASNYFLDINKPDPNIRKVNEQTDYINWLSTNRPKMLIEIHGHNGEKSDFAIEVSSGDKRENCSLVFAQKLVKEMRRRRFPRTYTVSGNYSSLKYKAKEALTINSDSWSAFHVELCPELRLDDGNAKKISNSIASTVLEMYKTKLALE